MNWFLKLIAALFISVCLIGYIGGCIAGKQKPATDYDPTMLMSITWHGNDTTQNIDSAEIHVYTKDTITLIREILKRYTLTEK